MDIYDLQGNVITNPDLTLGHLEDRNVIIHHDAIQGVEEVWHYEVIAEYPNGGKDIRKIIDVPGVNAMPAYDEEVCRKFYIPYTEEELDALAAQASPPEDEEEDEGISEIETLQQQIDTLEDELMAAKILLGLAT